MCHQPFENWIFEQNQLTAQQRNLLEEHLETCAHCRRLQSNWRAVHIKLTSEKQVRPADGFSTRWKITLQQRIEEQRMKQVRQVRRFFLFLGVANILSLVLFIGFVLFGGGLNQQLATITNRLAGATEWIETLQSLVFALLQLTSPILPLVIWILISTVFSILALIWVVSLWRITFQGVKSR